MSHHSQNLTVREMGIVQSNHAHDLFQQELRGFAFPVDGRGNIRRGGHLMSKRRPQQAMIKSRGLFTHHRHDNAPVVGNDRSRYMGFRFGGGTCWNVGGVHFAGNLVAKKQGPPAINKPSARLALPGFGILALSFESNGMCKSAMFCSNEWAGRA